MSFEMRPGDAVVALRNYKRLVLCHDFCLGLFVFAQILIEDFDNIILPIILFFCSSICIRLSGRLLYFKNGVIPVLMIWMFDLSNIMAPLFFKSIELSGLSEGLNAPWLTYSQVVIALISFLAGMYLCFNFGIVERCSGLVSPIIGSITSIARWPADRVLMLAGIVGISSRLLTGGYAEDGFDASIPVYIRIIEGFSFLAYSPFLIPFRRTFTRSEKKYSRALVWSLFALLFGVAILRNYRAVVVDALMIISMLYLISKMGGWSEFKMPPLSKLLGALLALYLICIGSDRVLGAIVAAREFRSDGPFVVAEQTLKNLSDPTGVLEFRRSMLERSTFTGYSEDYVNGFAASRFVMTKFHDNVISRVDGISPDARSEYFDFIFMKSIGSLPQPVLTIFGVALDKNEINSSAGDFVLYVTEGWGLSGYRTGSLVGEMFLFMGWWSFIGFAAFSGVVVSIIIPLLTLPRGEITIIGMLLIWRLVGTLASFGLNSESIYRLAAFIERGYIQSLFIFIFVVMATGYFFKSRSRNV